MDTPSYVDGSASYRSSAAANASGWVGAFHTIIIARDFTIYAARNKATPLASWINRLLATKPARVVAIAVANKLARIAWTLIHSGQKFLAAKACVPVTGAAA